MISAEALIKKKQIVKHTRLLFLFLALGLTVTVIILYFVIRSTQPTLFYLLSNLSSVVTALAVKQQHQKIEEITNVRQENGKG